jgi:hypothetical protein
MRPRAVKVTAGTIALATPAIPVSAVALAAGTSDAQAPVRFSVERHRVGYGESLTVTGNAPRSERGRTLALEYASAGGSWHVVSRARIHTDGSYRLAAPVHRSGAVRVVPDTSVTGARAVQPGRPGPGRVIAAVAPSAPQPVDVAAKLLGPAGSIDALSGQPVSVHGTLLPRQAGRLVRLEGRSTGPWHALAAGRTRADGRFELGYRAGGTGQQTVRLSFAGDRLNGGARSGETKTTAYRESQASWYSDGGTTACGFHADMGVANKDLPCGTKVSFHYGGRSVTAVVDDRGPYVGGREWDLNQNVAGALGFDGVGTVWSSR